MLYFVSFNNRLYYDVYFYDFLHLSIVHYKYNSKMNDFSLSLYYLLTTTTIMIISKHREEPNQST
jgi:hypothetical protein